MSYPEPKQSIVTNKGKVEFKSPRHSDAAIKSASIYSNIISKFFKKKIIRCTKCKREVLVSINQKVNGYICDACKYKEEDGEIMGGGLMPTPFF